jgi:hypothetical protein
MLKGFPLFGLKEIVGSGRSLVWETSAFQSAGT